MYPNRFKAKTTLDATSPLPGAAGQSTAQSALQIQRERILQNILVGTVIFSIIALIATIPPRLEKQQYTLIGIFVAAFICLLVVTFLRQIAYTFRAVFFLGLLTLLGFSTLFSDGLYGNGRLFLMALPIVTAILLGPRQGYAALAINIGALVAAALLMLTGSMPPPLFGSGNVNASISFWVLAIATATLVSAVTVISLVSMFRSLEGTLNSEQRLRQELNTERSALEGRIQDRTQDLERRLVQIRTAAEISLALNSQLEPELVLQQVVDLVQKRFDLYYVGVFLVDDERKNAVLRAGSGEAGQRMLQQGHHLPLDGTSMIAWAVNQRQPRIALDVGKEAVRFNNPLLPLTRSEMALPIITQELSADLPGRAIGAMTVQSMASSAFDEDDITVLRNITASLATALQNALLFKQVGRSLDEIRTLNRQYLEQAWSTTNLQPVRVVAQTAPGLEETAERSENFEVSLPLALRDQVIGSLNVTFPGEGQTAALVDADREFLEIIAAQTALALENVRLVEETQRRASYDRLLNTITRSARSSTDLDTILRAALQELGDALGASEAVIQLQVDPTEGKRR